MALNPEVDLATELLDGRPTAWTDYRFQNCSLTQLHLVPSPYVDVFNEFTHL